MHWKSYANDTPLLPLQVSCEMRFLGFFFCQALLPCMQRGWRRGEKSYLIVNSFWAPMHNVVKCMKKSHFVCMHLMIWHGRCISDVFSPFLSSSSSGNYLPACLPAYRGVSSLGMPGCHSPPLSTRGPHYAQLIATGTPGFSDLQTSLLHALQTVHHIFQPIQDFLDF